MAKEFNSDSLLAEAHDYYKLSVGGLKRKNIFTNEILYNTISISIEKYIMGLFVSHKQLPQCHTLFNMITEMKKFATVDDNLVQQMHYFDKKQQICSLATYNKKDIADEDILNFIYVLNEVKRIVLSNLVTNS